MTETIPMVITASRTVTSFCRVSPELAPPEVHAEKAQTLWALALAGKIMYDDTEITGAEEALWVCLECLGPLAVTGTATQLKVTLAENATRPSMSYGSLSDISLRCSDDACECAVESARQEELLTKLGYSTSDVD